MKQTLKEINYWVESEVRKFALEAKTDEVVSKYTGILIPFGCNDTEDPWIILNCVEELSLIFETKERAPYKVVFEVCK
jgi:hypothetical protein